MHTLQLYIVSQLLLVATQWVFILLGFTSACSDAVNAALAAKLLTRTAAIGFVEMNPNLEGEALQDTARLAGTDAANCDRGSIIPPYEVKATKRYTLNISATSPLNQNSVTVLWPQASYKP